MVQDWTAISIQVIQIEAVSSSMKDRLHAARYKEAALAASEGLILASCILSK